MFLDGLRACSKMKKSKWEVAVGKLPSQFCCKRRRVFTLASREDLWGFLRTVRELTQKQTFSAGKIRLKPLPSDRHL